MIKWKASFLPLTKTLDPLELAEKKLPDDLAKAVASLCFTNCLGLRRGPGEVVGDAHAFTDCIGVGPLIPVGRPPLYVWIARPNDERFQPRWNGRLWNSCFSIIQKTRGQEATASVVSGSTPGAERYAVRKGLLTVDIDKDFPDTYSFAKMVKKQLGKSFGAPIPIPDFLDTAPRVEMVRCIATFYLAVYDVLLESVTDGKKGLAQELLFKLDDIG
ncbi:hypothetical protein D0T12_22435 [Actinomadura spongiicola]|uniref:Uncharacterized protein n=1 Tax=Actinomadura spongiicola TaxID=2303421 RepID=A0A372GCR8_9ACTN|nr:hypothetical protein [Actinomadura spongiicola]RFS82962.1 hypothetical protein D0T12_22435 [Actinomadura spongiicola]